ncbi:hypothetical protein R5R35_009145 [Gryllus longicercus]|uniref:Uncharacterized protein n=1 Tax=Gryllus longicercus TaxID=2509291 RepID=A0AAN9UYV6_9ORTH
MRAVPVRRQPLPSSSSSPSTSASSRAPLQRQPAAAVALPRPPGAGRRCGGDGGGGGGGGGGKAQAGWQTPQRSLMCGHCTRGRRGTARRRQRGNTPGADTHARRQAGDRPPGVGRRSPHRGCLRRHDANAASGKQPPLLTPPPQKLHLAEALTRVCGSRENAARASKNFRGQLEINIGKRVPGF